VLNNNFSTFLTADEFQILRDIFPIVTLTSGGWVLGTRGAESQWPHLTGIKNFNTRS